MKKNITCQTLDNYGNGILKYERLYLRYKDALIGDVFECVIKNRKIEVIKRIKDSKDRTTPFCPYYHLCGGCQLQHMHYLKELDYKKHVVKSHLKKVNLTPVINDTIKDEDPYHYRTKLITTYQPGHKHKLISGLYEEESHRLVEVKDCPIQNKLGNRIIKTINNILIKHKIKAYDEDKQTGIIRHLLIRVGLHTNEVLVCFIIGSNVFPGINNVLKDLTKDPHIKSVYLNINQRKSSAITSNRFKHLYGAKYIKDKLLGLTYLIGPDTFYQVNPTQAEKLYDVAIKGLELTKTDTLLDCFSGIGTISLTASKYVKEVIGVEYVKASTELAIRNAKLNQITNATFITDDATTFIHTFQKPFNKLIVDPPRSGLDKSFIEAILLKKPQRISYVSCNPETLARDLNILKTAYHIESVTPLDMFCHTYHIESVTLLTLKK